MLFQALSQEKKFASANKSGITINGTSNLHDWSETVENFTATGVFTINDNKIIELTDAWLSAKVESIESGNKTMNEKTYTALKSETYPKITFIQEKNATILNKNTISINGNLTISGVQKSIKLTLKYMISEEGILCQTSAKLKMTNYGIDPPKAMLGTIKCGNEVTINFNLFFKN